MFKEIDVIKDLALKYSKPQLGRMAQLGMIEPQKAMMAGMMRDRIAKEDAKPPTATVAQDVLGLQPPQQQQPQPQQMGMPQTAQPQPQQAPQPQMGMPQQPEQPPMDATQMAATGGLTSLPVPEQDYAGGGIVAFDDGGEVSGYARGGIPQMPNMNFNLEQYTAAPVGEDFISNALAERKGIYEQEGVINPYEGLMKKSEDKRGEIGTRKEQAKGEFLMNLGVGLMGAKRGQEMAALGAGAMKGMSDYKDAMKDVRQSEEKLEDRVSAYELANYQAKKLGTDAAIDKRDAARKDLLAAQNKNVESKNAATIEGKKLEMQGYNTAMGYKGTVDAAHIRNAATPDFLKIANSPDLIKDMPNSTLAQRLEAVGQYQHPKDVYNALSARQSNVVKAIADAQGPLWLQYSDPKVKPEQKQAILTQIQDVATKIKAQANWTKGDEDRLQQLNKQSAPVQEAQALPMPPTEAELKKGALYTTAQGPAIWNGTAFEAAPAK